MQKDKNLEQSINESGQDLNRYGKKAYHFAKNFKHNKESAKVVGKALISFLKWLLGLVTASFSSILFIILLVIFIVICSVFVSLFGFDLTKKNPDDFNLDDAVSKACEVSHSGVYDKMVEAYVEKLKAIDMTMRLKIIEKFNNSNADTKHPQLTIDNLEPVDDSGQKFEFTKETVSWNYKVNLSGSDENGDFEWTTTVNIPVKLNTEFPSELIDTIVGYLQANYTVIKTYNSENKTFQDMANNVKIIDIKIGQKTPNGEEVTEDTCSNHGGTVDNNICKAYRYIPENKTTTKTAINIIFNTLDLFFFSFFIVITYSSKSMLDAFNVLL